MSINFPSALSTDLKKCFLSVKFLLSVIVFLILIFSTGCVLLDTDTPDYSIAEFIFKTDKSLWLKYSSYSCVDIFAQGFSNQWLGIFIPFLTAFACVPVFCDEYTSTCWRHYVYRIGIKKYILSKFLCSVIISFALVIICYLAFAAVCFSVFPYPEEYAEGIFYRAWYNYYGINKILSSDSYLIFIFGRICTASIIGAVGGLFCLILSSMTMSKYVSLGIPVLVYFFFAQVAKPYKFSGNMSDLKFWFLDNSSRFSSMETWFTDYMGIPLWVAYAYFLTVIALLLIIYYYIMKRRLKQ